MFERAKSVAQESDFKGTNMGCVITYKGHVISQAANTKKTSPIQKHYNKYRHFRNNGGKVVHSLHCETRALSLIPYTVAQKIDWSRVNVYIFRIAPGLPLGHGNARPCEGCMQALRDKGIQNVYYSTNDGFAYERVLSR